MIVYENNLYTNKITCTICTSSSVCNSCKQYVFATSGDAVTSDDANNDHFVDDENHIQD